MARLATAREPKAHARTHPATQAIEDADAARSRGTQTRRSLEAIVIWLAAITGRSAPPKKPTSATAALVVAHERTSHADSAARTNGKAAATSTS